MKWRFPVLTVNCAFIEFFVSVRHVMDLRRTVAYVCRMSDATDVDLLHVLLFHLP